MYAIMDIIIAALAAKKLSEASRKAERYPLVSREEFISSCLYLAGCQPDGTFSRQ
jgi:hypothetical protein